MCKPTAHHYVAIQTKKTFEVKGTANVESCEYKALCVNCGQFKKLKDSGK